MSNNVEEYIQGLSEERKAVVDKLRKEILKNIPTGFEECISYKMIGYVVPHSIYPDGYHCTPALPLPFMNIASTKGHVAIYHMGVYGSKSLKDWFESEWPKHSTQKLDMGGSCIRFKKMEGIPYELIGQLASKMTVAQWIEAYETAYKNAKK
jgi:uncharacterized protein YdhG (YjbR/CyaY superfamily)